MYTVNINNTLSVDVNANLNKITNTNEPVKINALDNGGFEVIVNNEKLNADIIDFDAETKQVKIKINQNLYIAQIQEPSDILLNKIGIKIAKPKKANNLISPMPGLILKILVTEGQQVKKGESLIILEAMKMENVFKAANDCTIKEIKIIEKQAVEKGQELILFE